MVFQRLRVCSHCLLFRLYRTHVAACCRNVASLVSDSIGFASWVPFGSRLQKGFALLTWFGFSIHLIRHFMFQELLFGETAVLSMAL